MTATKEQPNQRQNQPQQDEVGYWLFSGLGLHVFLHFVHNAKLCSLCSARSVRSPTRSLV